MKLINEVPLCRHVYRPDPIRTYPAKKQCAYLMSIKCPYEKKQWAYLRSIKCPYEKKNHKKCPYLETLGVNMSDHEI